jgi:hypothetical protein
MTRPTHDQWMKLVLGAFAVGLAWAAMSAAVHGKVDKAEYRADQARVNQRLDDADSLKRDVRLILCHLQPQTIGCPR